MTESKTKIKNIKCTYPNCDWLFDCKYKYDRHLKSHTKEKSIKCEKCDKTFSYVYNMKVHLKSHDKNSKTEILKKIGDELSFTCPIKRCIKKFETKDDLEQHVKDHDSQNKCSIPGCGKVFQRPSLLKQHLLIHSGEKPFKCDICSKSFVAAQNLKHHKLIHANRKEFVCLFENCGKAFNSSDYLKSHQRTHEKDKKHPCPQENCHKWFVCKETLKTHMKGHDNKREYVCDFDNCKKSYLTSSNLNFHKKSHQQINMKKKVEVPVSTIKSHEVTSNVINVNDFINTNLFGDEKSKKKNSNTENQTLYTEDLLAAAFGEIACNEYINSDNIKEIPLPHISTSDNENEFDDDNLLQATMIEDIQFQEEFPANIYMQHSVNNYRTFITGHDYQQSQYDIPSLPSPVIDKDEELTAAPSLVVNDMDYISETSMELSTGHLEIDGGYFCSSLCLPDHLYSHQVP